MKREELEAALSAVLGGIRAMGPEKFRAEIEARKSGDLALALADLESFASDYLTDFLTISVVVNNAICWGAIRSDSFVLADLECWIAANDSNFKLAA